MKSITVTAVAMSALLLTAWGAPKIAAPSELKAPAPIEGDAGRYASPFTSDGVTAGWVTKSMQVKAAGQIGSMAGSYAGQKALESVPFVGGFLGQKAGAAIGQSMALSAIGGEEFIRETSDLSFDSLQDMAVFIYVNYSSNPEYQKILEATWALYPEFQTVYYPALQAASAGR